MRDTSGLTPNDNLERHSQRHGGRLDGMRIPKAKEETKEDTELYTVEYQDGRSADIIDVKDIDEALRWAFKNIPKGTPYTITRANA